MQEVPTLIDAINAETKTSAEQKSEQLAILQDGAENLTQDELEGIIQGNFSSLAPEYSESARNSLKELAIYRINNDLNIHPFSEYTGEVGPCFY